MPAISLEQDDDAWPAVVAPKYICSNFFDYLRFFWAWHQTKDENLESKTKRI
jgi:hypothetical protein